jgi:type IV pilus assembly protein PilQ
MLLILVGSSLFAKDNSLVAIKVIPLPDDKVRIDFKFAERLEKSPSSFITQKPLRLVGRKRICLDVKRQKSANF